MKSDPCRTLMHITAQMHLINCNFIFFSLLFCCLIKLLVTCVFNWMWIAALKTRLMKKVDMLNTYFPHCNNTIQSNEEFRTDNFVKLLLRLFFLSFHSHSPIVKFRFQLFFHTHIFLMKSGMSETNNADVTPLRDMLCCLESQVLVKCYEVYIFNLKRNWRNFNLKEF